MTLKSSVVGIPELFAPPFWAMYCKKRVDIVSQVGDRVDGQEDHQFIVEGRGEFIRLYSSQRGQLAQLDVFEVVWRHGNDDIFIDLLQQAVSCEVGRGEGCSGEIISQGLGEGDKWLGQIILGINDCI